MSDEQESEDWFERALAETEDEEAPAADAEGDAVPTEDGNGDGEDWFERALRDDGTVGTAAQPADGTESTAGDTQPEGAESSVGGEVGDTPFAQDFATEFANAPSPDGSQPVSDDTPFDDQPFDSKIPRIDIGIEGLDEMIQGGVPKRSLMVAIGDAGTGKTTIGLQFLHEGLENGENGVFIALEENRDRIINTADEKGWNFSTYVDEGQLAVIDLDPIEMANSLTSIRSELPGLVREFDASRLVLDSVSLLEMMYEDQAGRRSQIYDFTQSLKEAGVTTMLTSEASEKDPSHSRYGIIEYLTDVVFVLRYIRPDDLSETRLAIEIQKIRDANHSREMKPYEITNEGISVYRRASIF